MIGLNEYVITTSIIPYTVSVEINHHIFDDSGSNILNIIDPKLDCVLPFSIHDEVFLKINKNRDGCDEYSYK